MCIGYDVRPSSQKICEAASRGLTDGGADVYNIGLCGTEMMYFGTFFYKMDGGFMITASHNPSNYNGIKSSDRKESLSARIQALRILKNLLFPETSKSPRKGNCL